MIKAEAESSRNRLSISVEKGIKKHTPVDAKIEGPHGHG
jgi:hypothetical protein